MTSPFRTHPSTIVAVAVSDTDVEAPLMDLGGGYAAAQYVEVDKDLGSRNGAQNGWTGGYKSREVAMSRVFCVSRKKGGLLVLEEFDSVVTKSSHMNLSFWVAGVEGGKGGLQNALKLRGK